MISTPFIIFYAIGMIFQSGLDYLIKLIAFVGLYIAIHIASNYIYDERLYYVLPMSIYLATKVCYQIIYQISKQFILYRIIFLSIIDQII
jgi:esterase/lipase superfamily enzyme